MQKRVILWLLLAGCVFWGGSLWADTLVQYESSRVYMDSERKQAGELWLTQGKSCQKSGNRVWIFREDLNRRWIIDLGEKTYWEYPLKESQAPAAPEKVDVHTLWLNYSPEFEWKVTETGETKDISGFTCRRYEVKGIADFAEADGEYWLADSAATPAGKAYRDYLVKQLEGDADRGGLLKLLGEHSSLFPVLRQDVLERSIAPTIRQTYRIVKFEEAAAPGGVYDLPAGLKKLGGKDN